MSKRIIVQAVETAADGESFPARELLPWADPYIAALMGRLENEADDDAWEFDVKSDEEGFEDEEFLAEDLPADEDWHLDREPRFPPVYGGWPLLNDA